MQSERSLPSSGRSLFPSSSSPDISPDAAKCGTCWTLDSAVTPATGTPTVVSETPSGHVPASGVLCNALIGARILLLEVGDLEHTAELPPSDFTGERQPVTSPPRDLGNGTAEKILTLAAMGN